MRDRQFTALDQWLESPESIPLDLVAETMDSVFFSNRTLYPRRSAWTTMIVGGQLGKIDTPDLVMRLDDYEQTFDSLILEIESYLEENGFETGT